MRKGETAREAGGNRTPEQAFGLTLRKIRLKRGLSQQALADKSGYHRTYIGFLEGGHKSPSLRTLFDLAATLQVRPSKLMASVERLVNQAERKRRGISGNLKV
jgi:transcriptional regulator with XRE-family HTH domain